VFLEHSLRLAAATAALRPTQLARLYDHQMAFGLGMTCCLRAALNHYPSDPAPAASMVAVLVNLLTIEEAAWGLPPTTAKRGVRSFVGELAACVVGMDDDDDRAIIPCLVKVGWDVTAPGYAAVQSPATHMCLCNA
jgi:hypothetical protein